MIEIRKVDTKPQLDPYHRDTLGASCTVLKFDPQNKVVWVEQDYDDNATPSDEWHKLVLTYQVTGSPDESAVRSYLEGPGGQSLLEAIADGFEVVWDGHNNIGVLSDDAEAASEKLGLAIDFMPESGWEAWGAAEWFDEYNLVLAGLTPDMSDEALESLAEELEAEAEGDMVVILDSVSDYLKERRAELAN